MLAVFYIFAACPVKLPGTKCLGMIKCEIIVDGYLYGITNDLKNWDDVLLSIKRGN